MFADDRNRFMTSGPRSWRQSGPTIVAGPKFDRFSFFVAGGFGVFRAKGRTHRWLIHQADESTL